MGQAEAARLEEQIGKEFEKLHEFLRGEEKALLARLQEETRRKHGLIEGKMKRLAKERQTLLNEAFQLQADLKEDDYTFLMVKGTHRGAALSPVGCHPRCDTLLPPPGCEVGGGGVGQCFGGLPAPATPYKRGSDARCLLLFQSHKNRKRR